MESAPSVQWTQGGRSHAARWRSERGAPPPKRVVIADDAHDRRRCLRPRLPGHGAAVARRLPERAADAECAREPRGPSCAQAEARHRRADRSTCRSERPRWPRRSTSIGSRARSVRARSACCSIELDADYGIGLRRAPDLRQACREAYGPADGPSVVSLRELLGLVGAHEWRIKGIDIPAAGGRIHPHYGVFAPVRREYVDLVANAPLPAATAATSVAFDIGTGTGVLAAVLARRGLARVIATDQDPRALACARANIDAARPARQGRRRRRPISFRQDAPRWCCAIRRGCPRGPARRSNTASTIRRAGCCAAFSRDSPRIWHRRAKAGSSCRISPSISACGRATELLAAIDAAALRVVDRTDVRPDASARRSIATRSAARGARGRSDVAVATRGALRGPRRRSRVG